MTCVTLCKDGGAWVSALSLSPYASQYADCQIIAVLRSKQNKTAITQGSTGSKATIPEAQTDGPVMGRPHINYDVREKVFCRHNPYSISSSEMSPLWPVACCYLAAQHQ